MPARRLGGNVEVKCPPPPPSKATNQRVVTVTKWAEARDEAPNTDALVKGNVEVSSLWRRPPRGQATGEVLWMRDPMGGKESDGQGNNDETKPSHCG